MKALSSRPFAGHTLRIALAVIALGAVGLALMSGSDKPSTPSTPSTPSALPAPRAALTVSLISPQTLNWPRLLPANGSITAWQEALVGAEISNYRIIEVGAEVGDRVRKGQVLLRIANDTVASELAEARAAVAELEASATEARDNAARATELRTQGFYSSQLNTQYQTAQHTAAARLAAARARQQSAEVRMSKTIVLAPDDGVISARSAAVGSLTQAGQELFRLIRGGRLEWRAEVPSAELASIRPGLVASLSVPGGQNVRGTVRIVAPGVDPQTRNGLVYVDVPASAGLRAGMFARGEFELAMSPALTLPQTALVLRDGFAYVFRVDEGQHVSQLKLALGRRVGERVEILSGLTPEARVVASGAGFLADGDLVKVIAGSAQP